MKMHPAILVGIGGTIGTILRYLLGAVIPDTAGIPLGVLLINVGGSLALGWLLAALAARGPDRARIRLFFGTGVLGGFTTYSTLALGSFEFITGGSVGLGIAYALASLVLGVVAAAIGILIGRRMPAVREDRR